MQDTDNYPQGTDNHIDADQPPKSEQTIPKRDANSIQLEELIKDFYRTDPSTMWPHERVDPYIPIWYEMSTNNWLDLNKWLIFDLMGEKRAETDLIRMKAHQRINRWRVLRKLFPNLPPPLLVYKSRCVKSPD